MNSTDWIQAICALATTILAVVTFYQGRKIKTLTDIVESLNNQTDVWKSIFEIEAKSRLYEIHPVFVTSGLVDEHLTYRITLRNIGRKARGLTVSSIQNVKPITNPEVRTVLTGKIIEFRFAVIDKAEWYKIKIEYYGEFDDRYGQILKGRQNHYVIMPPVAEPEITNQ